jgi:hypothetical protein
MLAPQRGRAPSRPIFAVLALGFVAACLFEFVAVPSTDAAEVTSPVRDPSTTCGFPTGSFDFWDMYEAALKMKATDLHAYGQALTVALEPQSDAVKREAYASMQRLAHYLPLHKHSDIISLGLSHAITWWVVGTQVHRTVDWNHILYNVCINATAEYIKDCIHGVGHAAWVAVAPHGDPCSSTGMIEGLSTQDVVDAYWVCKDAPSGALESYCATGFYHGLSKHVAGSGYWPCDGDVPFLDQCFYCDSAATEPRSPLHFTA